MSPLDADVPRLADDLDTTADSGGRRPGMCCPACGWPLPTKPDTPARTDSVAFSDLAA